MLLKDSDLRDIFISLFQENNKKNFLNKFNLQTQIKTFIGIKCLKKHSYELQKNNTKYMW